MALSLSPLTRPTLAASNREFLASSVLKNCIRLFKKVSDARRARNRRAEAYF
jgi:hypothetical protein